VQNDYTNDRLRVPGCWQIIGPVGDTDVQVLPIIDLAIEAAGPAGPDAKSETSSHDRSTSNVPHFSFQMNLEAS
jgi:hypothetical protein